MTDFVPPADPCTWRISKEGQLIARVSRCQTAHEAWKKSKLPKDFGFYQYEQEKEEK